MTTPKPEDFPTPETDAVLAKCHQSTPDIDFADFAEMHDHAKRLERRLALAEWKLNYNRCHSGHETLPLVLWDCPECHNETKRKLEECRSVMLEVMNGSHGAMVRLRTTYRNTTPKS